MRPVVAARAKRLAELLGTDVSGLIQQLITAEYERRQGAVTFHEAATPYRVAAEGSLKGAVAGLHPPPESEPTRPVHVPTGEKSSQVGAGPKSKGVRRSPPKRETG